MKEYLRPVVRRVRRLSGQAGRPPTSAEAVSNRWRALSSDLVRASHFHEAGLENVWERNLPKLDRQIIVMQSLRNVIAAGVPGSVAEFGCFEGHTAIQIAHTLQTLGDDSRLFLFDSFEGMPASGRPEDCYWGEGAMSADYQVVKKRFERFEHVEVVRGFFRETLPAFENLSLKFAHVDCDMSASIRELHGWLLDHMVVGGMIVYDDYGFESCFGLMQAVDEDMAERRDYMKFSLPTGQYVAIRFADDVSGELTPAFRRAA